MSFRIALLIASIATVSSVHAQDTIQVKAGWNIIGSVKAGAIPDVLSTIPDSLITSAYWGYTSGVGYSSTDTLDDGIGYWVKAESDGLIVFNNAPPVDSCKAKAFIYQGKLYNTVKIGDQCWMAENLDVGAMVPGLATQVDNGTIEKYCYLDDSQNCILYGALYQWDEAMQYTTTPGARGICPEGWHLPTVGQFETLLQTVENPRHSLKAIGQGAGINSSGFSGLLAGFRTFDSGGFLSYTTYGAFWSSTDFDNSFAYILAIDEFNAYVSDYVPFKPYGLSVRCVED